MAVTRAALALVALLACTASAAKPRGGGASSMSMEEPEIYEGAEDVPTIGSVKPEASAADGSITAFRYSSKGKPSVSEAGVRQTNGIVAHGQAQQLSNGFAAEKDLTPSRPAFSKGPVASKRAVVDDDEEFSDRPAVSEPEPSNSTMPVVVLLLGMGAVYGLKCWVEQDPKAGNFVNKMLKTPVAQQAQQVVGLMGSKPEPSKYSPKSSERHQPGEGVEMGFSERDHHAGVSAVVSAATDEEAEYSDPEL